MPTFTHAGLELHYLDEGKGLPVLLLHAFPLHGGMFEEQVRALSRKYRFIIPDLRGFGRSAVGPGPSEMSAFADDALALLDHLGISSAVVGGVSMGGYAATALLQADPGRVSGLVLSDTQMGADDEATKARREDTARNIEARGMDVLVETLLPKLLAPSATPELRDRVAEMIRSNPPAGSAAASRGMGMRPDSKGILARFAGLALLVYGEEDAITPRAKMEQMKDVLSSVELFEIAHAAHLPNLEQPSVFNEALDAFLSRIAG